MERTILPGLRTTFLVHMVVALIFGLAFLLVPEFLWGIYGMTVQEPLVNRLLGAAILAFGASSWWASRETLWERVRIIVETELVWTVLGAIVGAVSILMLGLPALTWINALILAAFAVAFGYFYVRETSVTTTTQTR